MRIDILTLFKEQFNGFLETSIIKRAIDRKQVEISLVDIRDFVQNKHRQVDDTVYGGGSGMVIMVEPVVLAIESVKTKDSKVILLTPSGDVYNQDKAISLSKEKHLIIICGHYEGIDERIKHFIDMEISIGDFVLTGGEIPSMVLVDSITRLLDGVITKESLESESFNDNLLDYAVYTKPRNFRGYEVPEVLVSGNHELIRKYREEERIRRTNERRKDLIDNVK
jgi:tRNA (guanine-N(1)-)-methyltransferase